MLVVTGAQSAVVLRSDVTPYNVLLCTSVWFSNVMLLKNNANKMTLKTVTDF